MYFSTKPADMPFPRSNWLSETAPFVQPPADASPSSLVHCPTFEELGFCPQGYKCRYLSSHQLAPVAPEEVGKLMVDEEKKAASTARGFRGEKNWIGSEAMKNLRTNRVSTIWVKVGVGCGSVADP